MEHRIFTTPVNSVYPLYLQKVQKKGRTQEELDQVFFWLTGHDAQSLQGALDQGLDFRRFFAQAPGLNPARLLVTGTVCGVRVEAVEDPLMRDIRILDKLVEDLARGKPLAKILK